MSAVQISMHAPNGTRLLHGDELCLLYLPSYLLTILIDYQMYVGHWLKYSSVRRSDSKQLNK